jgi:hypothetical protein
MRTLYAMQLAVLLLLGSAARAQEIPKAELAGDYSFVRYAPSAAYTQGHSLNGGGGTFKYNIGPLFGIAMDLQGYNSNTVKFSIPPNPKFPYGASGSVSGNLFTYLFGPVVKLHARRAQPYFDFLLGAAHSNVYGNAYAAICQPIAGTCAGTGSPSGNAFAMSVGGGVDVPINRRVQFRVVEFDWLGTHFNNEFTNSGQSNFRFLTGININLGVAKSKS